MESRAKEERERIKEEASEPKAPKVSRMKGRNLADKERRTWWSWRLRVGKRRRVG